MKTKIVLLIVFVIVAIVQLYIPASMVLKGEDIINQGFEYKFKIAPVDPNDPFRGKYITLNFEANTYYVSDSIFGKNQPVYVVLKNDDEGYAAIDYVLDEKPVDNLNFVSAKVGYILRYDRPDGNYIVRLDYPFKKFYMEESKAPEAESLYWEAARDSNMVAYALVNVIEGKVVVKDVMINDTSIVGLADKRLIEEK